MMLARPWLLLLLVPWLLWIVRRWRQENSGGRWSRLIEPDLLTSLSHRSGGRAHRITTLSLALAGGLIILALAGPAQPLTGGDRLSQGSLVVVLDNTLSMAVEDVAPSRQVRAARVVRDWAGSDLFRRTAVITYAGSAHWLTPFTRDRETLAVQLRQLNPFIMPRFGNRPDKAFARVAEKLAEQGERRVHLLWLTDDASPDRLDAIAAELKHSGRTWLMPVGTEAGGPIPLPDGQGFANDGERMVLPAIRPDEFTQAAERLNARLLTLGRTPEPAWLGRARRETSEQRAVREWGYWLLIPALLLLLPSYRRGLVYTLPLLFVLTPPAAEANTWLEALRLNREEQAWQAWRQADYERAESLTERPSLAASAAFERGDYATAIEHWNTLDTPDAHYNRGNALVRQGRLEEALAAYQQAIDQGHERARANHDKVQDFLERQRRAEDRQQQNQPNQQPQQNQQQQNPQQGQQDQQPSQSSESERDQQAQSGEEQQPSAESGDESSGRPRGDEAEQADDSAGARPGERDEPETAEQAEQRRREAEQRRRDQAVEQLLNRLPNPSGSVLQRKFQYQYRQNPDEEEAVEQPW